MVNVYQLVECEDTEIALVKEQDRKARRIHTNLYVASKSSKAGIPHSVNSSRSCLRITNACLQALKRAEQSGLEGDDAINAAFEENVKAGH